MQAFTHEELETWQWENGKDFPDLVFNMDIHGLLEFFQECCEPTRTRRHVMRGNAISIGERIHRWELGIRPFDASHFNHYTPEEGDRMGLFFFLLLNNLPLYNVKTTFHASTGRYQKPTNSTLMGFHREHAVRFRQSLGSNPSLSRWQTTCYEFLVRWCPPNKSNDFKWKHAFRSDECWFLTMHEIKTVSYITTGQFAMALMQYDVSNAG